MRRISVSLFLACALAACGGADNATNNTDQTETSPADTNTTTGTETPNGSNDNATDVGDTNNGTTDNTDTDSGDTNNGSTGTDNNQDNANNNAGNCDRTGFPEGTQTSARASSGGWQFAAADENTTAFLNVASFVNWDGPTTPGTYTLTGINYKDCGLCLLAGTGCQDGTCEKLYYAHEGTVDVTSAGLENGTVISGTLHNVVFEEVTIADDFTTTKVAGGKTWCFDTYTFNEVSVDPNAPQEVEAFDQTASSCVTGGNGTGLGHNIDNLQLQNCNGETISLHDHCGASSAVWYVHTAGWCTACDYWLPRVQQLYEQEATDGLEVYYVLGQDVQGEAPTAEYCTQYAEAKGVDPARLLMDNGAAGAWGVFQTSINMYDAGYIPWNAVLRGSNMEYLWADNVTDGTITGLEEAVEEALGKDVDFSVMLQE